MVKCKSIDIFESAKLKCCLKQMNFSPVDKFLT